MGDREATLEGLGITVGSSLQELNIITAGSQAGLPSDIPCLSGFGEFTPVTARSYTTVKWVNNADMERNKHRD
jgi:hypothetical protein